MRNKKMVILSICAVIMLTSITTGCHSGKPASNEKTGKESSVTKKDTMLLGNLNTFKAKALDGSTFTQSDFRSKDVTAINLWSSTCGPCIEEMPEIAKFSKTLPSNIQFVTVCLDGSGDTENVKSILRSAGYEGTTILEGDGDFKTLCEKIQYTPTTIFVDKDGNMVGDVIIGGQENLADTFTKAINSVLKSLGKREM